MNIKVSIIILNWNGWEEVGDEQIYIEMHN